MAADAGCLYRRGASYQEIASRLDLTHAQVHNILTDLSVNGLPKPPSCALSDQQVQAIHAAYLDGGSIDELAVAIGFTGSAVHKLGLPARREAAG